MTAANFLVAHENWRDAQWFADVVKEDLLQFARRTLPLQPHQTPYVEMVCNSSEHGWEKVSILFKTQDVVSDPDLVSNAFDKVSVICGGQPIESIDGDLNAFLLFCQVKQRMPWYAQVFALLRASGLPKLVADTILSFCAFKGDNAPMLPILGCKIVKTCFIFYELLARHYAQIEVPVCLVKRTLRAPLHNLSLEILHEREKKECVLLLDTFCFRQQRRISSLYSSYYTRIQRNPIVQNRSYWIASDEKMFSRTTWCCLQLFPPRRMPISCVLFSIKCNQSSAVQVKDMFERVCLKWQENENWKTTATYSAQQCFLACVGKTFWFYIPATAQTHGHCDPVETILCGDVEQVGQMFLLRESGFVLSLQTTLESACTVKAYAKVWNQLVYRDGISSLWRV